MKLGNSIHKRIKGKNKIKFFFIKNKKNKIKFFRARLSFQEVSKYITCECNYG